MAAPSRRIPRRLPQQQRAQETVEAILTATARVLTAEGWKGASTNRIAEVAGVSIGTLYQYFPSKEALLTQLSRRHSERMQAVFERRFVESRALPLRQAVRLIIEAELESLQVDLPLLRVLFEQVPRFGPPKHIEQVQKRVVELLGEGLKERADETRPLNSNLDPFVLLHAVDGVCQAALRYHPELVISEEFLNSCTDLVLGFLRPDPSAQAVSDKKPST